MQLVVARRWDQLGGRLFAIVNARAIAELLGLEFGFVWPRGLDAVVNDPRQLFSRSFLKRFELEPSAVQRRPRVYHREHAPGGDAALRRALDEAGAEAFLEVDIIFQILGGEADTADVAAARFKRCFAELGWNDEVRRLLDFCAEWPPGEPIAGVHVRAGDIVTGAWRHGIVHEKYAPTPYVHHAIEQLTRGGERPVLVMSDNEPYLEWLKRHYAAVITCDQVVPGYGRLSELQRALADILILSRCELIAGPPSSAFSMLGASLGAGRLVRVDTLVSPGSELEVLLAGIDSASVDASLVARDICWCLDVFGDALPIGERRRLAERAAELEPDFPAALTHAARAAALAGDDDRARAAAAAAIPLAQRAERNEDPLLDALATEIAVACFAATRAGAEPDIGASFARCLELEPIWLAREDVYDALRSLINATTSEPVGEDRLERHRTVELFDPLTRELRLMANHLPNAIRS